MTYILKFIVIFFLFFFQSKNTLSLENKILFTVDNNIITSIDLYNEINYLKALNKELTKLDQSKIFEIAKKTIINDEIKKNEISKYTNNLILEDEYLNPFIKNIYDNLNLGSLENFKNYLSQFNVDFQTVREKLSLEIIWNDLVFSKFSKNIKIDEEKIRENLKINLSKMIKEFLLSEIIFNVSNNSNLRTKELLIYNDIEEKGFKNAALIHSISNTSQKNGGQIGWISENSLNSQIKKILANLEIGDYTKPILIPGGFLILKIDDIRIIENKNFNLENEVNETISLKRTEQLNNYSNIYFDKVKKEYTINAK